MKSCSLIARTLAFSIFILLALQVCSKEQVEVLLKNGRASSHAVSRRALPNAPNGYVPIIDICPRDRPSIRSAFGLSPNETSWLRNRQMKTTRAMRDLMDRLNITDFDAASYVDKHSNNASALPTIGIAISGGGYRAMLNGAGIVAAFDSRIENSTSLGHLGGILQSSTYFSGLSGGAWLVGSMYVNNFTTIPALLGDSSPGGVWDLDSSILFAPSTLSNQTYYRQLLDSVTSKRDAGFEVSITDIWGRALSYQLINATEGGIAYTWSSMALQTDFMDGNMPMPIAVAAERAPGVRAQLRSSNTTIFEFNPWEMGSFDPTTYAFAPLRYIGSKFSAGVLPDTEGCIRGLDNAGFVMGTSSSIFNEVLVKLNSMNMSEPRILRNLTNTITRILTNISEANLDIAIYNPNPFHGYHNKTNHNAHSTALDLVDGALDLQNIPLQPHLQPARHVDVLFAIDSSGDSDYGWPNGASMVATYQRYIDSSPIGNGTAFPYIPDQNTFINLGLNTRPTMFGCNSSNITGTGPGPLVIYLPNGPYSFFSNISTFELTYNSSVRNAIVQNGYDVATMANGTMADQTMTNGTIIIGTTDPSWPVCVGCAILSRSLERTGTSAPEACQRCFAKYCWDGTVNSTKPPLFDPKLALAPAHSGAAKVSLILGGVVLFVVLSVGLVDVH